jgi:hypothetical protein
MVLTRFVERVLKTLINVNVTGHRQAAITIQEYSRRTHEEPLCVI